MAHLGERICVSRWTDRLAPVLAAALVVVLLCVLWLRRAYPLDDAYITLHNARALIDHGGQDPVYGGAALTGATSLVHLAAVAALGYGLPLFVASQVLTAAGILAYAAGLWRFGQRQALSPRTCALLVVIGLASGYQPMHLVNGLETGWAMAAVIWTIVLADSRLLPLLCGLLPFLRPELALLAAPVLLRRLWHLRGDRRRCAGAIALALAAAAPFALWAMATTGHLLPNTAAAKLVFFGEAPMSPAERLAVMGEALGGSFLLPVCAGLVGLRRIRAGWAVAVFVALWLLLSLLTLPAALMHNHFRYLAILVPVAVAGLAALSRRYGPRFDGLLAGLALWSLATGSIAIAIATDPRAPRRLAAIADDVRRLTPPGAVILIHDAGYLAWAVPDRRMIDLVGLKSPASVRWNRIFIAGQGRRDRALDAIARTGGAHYLVSLTPGVPFWGETPGWLRQAGWRVDRLDRPQPGSYGLYRLTPPAPARTVMPGR